jgi:outer membrane biosynthesis protein TonB
MRDVAPNRLPALTASAALHGALLAATLIAWPWLSKPIRLSTVVPVTLVTSDKPSEMRGAVAAPTPSPAAAETPVPETAPQPPEPEPAPLPNPAPPPVKPAQTKPAPTPAKQPVKAASSNFDPDVELAKLTKSAKASGAKSSSAPRGPTRPETALLARLTTGTGDAATASAESSLVAAIIPHWNLSCDAPRDLDIRVTFRLSPSGRLTGPPQSSGDNAPEFSVLRVASERAKAAVLAAQPFENLPPNLYSQPITVKFNVQAALEQEHCG